MQVGERQLLDQTHGVGVVGGGLPREAGDDVGAQTDRLDGLGDFEGAAAVVLAGVPATHAAQHGIGAALQRHVQVRCQAAVRFGEQAEHAVVDFGRLDAAQPKP